MPERADGDTAQGLWHGFPLLTISPPPPPFTIWSRASVVTRRAHPRPPNTGVTGILTRHPRPKGASEVEPRDDLVDGVMLEAGATGLGVVSTINEAVFLSPPAPTFRPTHRSLCFMSYCMLPLICTCVLLGFRLFFRIPLAPSIISLL